MKKTGPRRSQARRTHTHLVRVTTPGPLCSTPGAFAPARDFVTRSLANSSGEVLAMLTHFEAIWPSFFSDTLTTDSDFMGSRSTCIRERKRVTSGES